MICPPFRTDECVVYQKTPVPRKGVFSVFLKKMPTRQALPFLKRERGKSSAIAAHRLYALHGLGKAGESRRNGNSRRHGGCTDFRAVVRGHLSVIAGVDDPLYFPALYQIDCIRRTEGYLVQSVRLHPNAPKRGGRAACRPYLLAHGAKPLRQRYDLFLVFVANGKDEPTGKRQRASRRRLALVVGRRCIVSKGHYLAG